MHKNHVIRTNLAEQETVEHGVEAFYAGGPGKLYYKPVLACTCGHFTGRCDSWFEAGIAMDLHLESVISLQ